MIASIVRGGVTALLLGSLLLLAGCFETKLTLGPKDSAVVDLAYVGDWIIPGGPDKPETKLAVRNLDGKQYFVVWEHGKDKPLYVVAFTATVKGVVFAHVRGLPDDGSIEEKHLLMRLTLKDGKLQLRNLDEKFFNGKTIDTDEQLRAIVEQNVENEAMYDKESIEATKAPQRAG